MILQWFRRLFSSKTAVADDTQDKLASATSQKKGAVEGSELVDSGAALLEYATDTELRLENAFFAWLLDCSPDDFSTLDAEHVDMQRDFLEFIEENLFDVDKLPRQPSSLPLLIKLLNDEESSNAQISKALLSDPALTAQILITANSPFFRRTQEPIQSIDQAVLSLGRQGIRNIVSASIMMPMMKNRQGKDCDLSTRVWEWGMASAFANEQYALSEGKEAGLVYLLGLLPPLSYLLIYNAIDNFLQQSHRLSVNPALVKSLLLDKSWLLCREICQQWGLPELQDAEPNPQEGLEHNPLKDRLSAGMYLSMYAVLREHEVPSIDADEMFSLADTSAFIDKKILTQLDAFIQASKS